MHTFKLPIKTEIPLGIGKALIAEPFLTDPNFVRAVIYLCEHDENGSLGFILNKPLEENLGDILPDLVGVNIPVYNGGPVEENVLYVLHQLPQLLGGSLIHNNVYLGADYEVLKKNLLLNKINLSKIKFFLGYSGWDKEQLANELLIDSWLVAPAPSPIIFSNNSKQAYVDAINNLDKKYSIITKMPINPLDN